MESIVCHWTEGIRNPKPRQKKCRSRSEGAALMLKKTDLNQTDIAIRLGITPQTVNAVKRQFHLRMA